MNCYEGMKFAHKFGVRSSLKTYFQKFLPPPKIGKKPKISPTAVDRKHILQNGSRHRQTTDVSFMINALKRYQTWGHHSSGLDATSGEN